VRIEGSLRSNLLAAIAGAKRWRGRPVHKDTLEHWTQLLDYSRRSSRPPGEALTDLIAELETELAQARATGRR
jgi:hypothetical protein